MAKILFKASSLTSTFSDLTMEYRRFSGSKQNVLPYIFLNAICWNSWGCSLILRIILKMCSCCLWNLLFLLISNQQLAYTFTIKFIKLWSFVVSLCGYAPRVYKHMSLMTRVTHLVWFKGPIFQEAYLESTLPLEIPTAYSYRSLWSQLRSCISSIFKIESNGQLIVENDIWGKSWQFFEHNFNRGPLNAVGPFAQPSLFLKRLRNYYGAVKNQLCEIKKNSFLKLQPFHLHNLC